MKGIGQLLREAVPPVLLLGRRQTAAGAVVGVGVLRPVRGHVLVRGVVVLEASLKVTTAPSQKKGRKFASKISFTCGKR